jgi:hypothetical protein
MLKLLLGLLFIKARLRLGFIDPVLLIILSIINIL